MAVIQRTGTRENKAENKRKCERKANAMLHNRASLLASEQGPWGQVSSGDTRGCGSAAQAPQRLACYGDGAVPEKKARTSQAGLEAFPWRKKWITSASQTPGLTRN